MVQGACGSSTLLGCVKPLSPMLFILAMESLLTPFFFGKTSQRRIRRFFEICQWKNGAIDLLE
jgi:hypothetical protein